MGTLYEKLGFFGQIFHFYLLDPYPRRDLCGIRIRIHITRTAFLSLIG